MAESKRKSSRRPNPCNGAKLWKPISTPYVDLNMGGAPRPLFLICGEGLKKDIKDKSSNVYYNELNAVYSTISL
jgi:hypothetical protein